MSSCGIEARLRTAIFYLLTERAYAEGPAELEEILIRDHLTDIVTQVPTANRLVACLRPLPLEDPFITPFTDAR